MTSTIVVSSFVGKSLTPRFRMKNRRKDMSTSTEPVFDLTIKENPARRLQAIMDGAGYENPAEFIVKALDVFERAMASGGRVVVEDEREGKRFVFHLSRR